MQTRTDARANNSRYTDSDFMMRFRVELVGIDPPIWRRIEVPANYSLWDLHVAIQDSMGWLDYHLHVFRFPGVGTSFGIPCEDGGDPFPTKPSWKASVSKFFDDHRPIAVYEYDFGDSWIHEVRLEDVRRAEPSQVYPRCLDGARRCPPEDCGGVSGYENFLRVIADPTDPEHEARLTWAGGSFNPEDFAPGSVRFDDPKERWARAFERA